MKSIYLAVTILLPLCACVILQEDDLVFDDIGEEASSSPAPIALTRHENKPHKTKKYNELERFWGVPDGIAVAGQVFKLTIPKQAFSGNIHYYTFRGNNGNSLPHWLTYDPAAFTILGVPTKKDEGQHRINIKAFGKQSSSSAEDNFTIRVLRDNKKLLQNHKHSQNRCDESEDPTMMTLILDAKFDKLTPDVRVETLENLAGFLAMHVNDFFMYPYGNNDDHVEASSVVLTGPGNVKRRKEKHSTVIQWQVGCDGHPWKHQSSIVKQIHGQAKDGTLAEVLQLPVLLWRMKTDTSDALRYRRETGSGDYGNNDDDDYNYDDEDEYGSYDDDEKDDRGDNNEAETEIPPSAFVPSAVEPNGAESEHPHRHHHGQETADWETEENIKLYGTPREPNRRVEFTPNETSISISPRLTPTTTTTTEQITSSPPHYTTTPQATTESVEIIQKNQSSSSTFADVTLKPTTTSTTIVTTAEPTTTPFNVTETSSDNNTQTELSQEITFNTTKLLDLEPTTAATIDDDDDDEEASSTDFTTHLGVISTSNARQEVNSTADELPVPPEAAASTTQKPAGVFISSSTWSETTTPEPTTSSTPSTTPSTTTTTTTTIPPLTTEEIVTTTSTVPPPTTTPTTTTEVTSTVGRMIPEIRNNAPTQDRRLKKIAVTAGKPLSFVIPPNTFSDREDGDTRNLKLKLFLKGHPLKTTHWLQFNEQTHEVYGLPLENDVSQWEYDIVASDRDGLNVTDRLDIYVQQHKFTRSNNHEFSIYLKIDKRSEFPTNVDWELRVVQRLAQLYGDHDTSHITVRNIEIENDQAIFSWTNDSLPRRSECPKEEIHKLLRVLIADDESPSPRLQSTLAPEIRVGRVVFNGIGQCESMNTPNVPEEPRTDQPKSNSFPIPRNPVDKIEAIVGQLLVFRVAEDTFYDAEDGSGRNMRMTLLTLNREEIPNTDWLQFDSKNQEFYGVPSHEDFKQNSRREYQLVVTDKDGASATDSLVVIIRESPVKRHPVEFTMTLEIPYEFFVHNAFLKRNFIEKLRDLFGDRDTSSISILDISRGSTVVKWRNVTLPTESCPNEEIERLMGHLVKSDKTMVDRVNEVMGKELPVGQVSVLPTGICEGQMTRTRTPEGIIPTKKDKATIGSSQDDYLITFILPAVIIAAMILLAGIIAFILYRRRRSGKMSVSEHDDERQSFRSKGIPVIFQDELEEKPDPGNKSPVILKEEKPPLPPPEYQKADDGADQPMLPKENSEEPYQPPPPFARTSDNSRQNRPKPTPTYRKPPPYVPP